MVDPEGFPWFPLKPLVQLGKKTHSFSAVNSSHCHCMYTHACASKGACGCYCAHEHETPFPNPGSTSAHPVSMIHIATMLQALAMSMHPALCLLHYASLVCSFGPDSPVPFQALSHAAAVMGCAPAQVEPTHAFMICHVSMYKHYNTL